MNKILVIYYCDNGEEDHQSDYYHSWKDDELVELSDDADPDVFVKMLEIETKKKYEKNKYGAKFLTAYLVSKIWDE